jgi:hypothetical protein
MKYAWLLLLVVGCSKKPTKPTDEKIEDLGITVTVPGGWSVSHDKGAKDVEFFGDDDLRHVTIEPAENPPASLDMLVEATAASKFKLLDKQTFATGYGVTFNDGKRDEFAYYATVGGKTFVCKPGPYYKPTSLAASTKLCASIR